jgi:hypothetical protein
VLVESSELKAHLVGVADKVLLRADAVDHRLLVLAVGRGVDIRELPVGVGHQLARPDHAGDEVPR